MFLQRGKLWLLQEAAPIRVRDERQCLPVLCTTQGIQGRENTHMLMMHLAVHQPDVFLATAKISASPSHWDRKRTKSAVLWATARSCSLSLFSLFLFLLAWPLANSFYSWSNLGYWGKKLVSCTVLAWCNSYPGRGCGRALLLHLPH